MKCKDKKLSIEVANDRVVKFVLKELSGKELEEFQLHLLECDYCNKRALAGLKVERILQMTAVDEAYDRLDIIDIFFIFPDKTLEEYKEIFDCIKKAREKGKIEEVLKSLEGLKKYIETSSKETPEKLLNLFSKKPEYKTIVSALQDLLSKDI